MEYQITELSRYWQQFWNFITPDSERLSEPEILIRLVIQVILMAGSALFSSSETALFSLSRLDLQNLIRQNHPLAATIHNLLEQPRRLIISILCGNEFINIAAAANMTVILVILYGEANAGWITIFVMVPLLLVLGEVTPKTIAVSNPLVISTRIVVPVIKVWVRIVAPLRWAVWIISEHITTLLVGREKSADNILHIDEFRTLVDDVVKNGELGSAEKLMIFNLLEAGATEVVEIMTPRTQMPFIDINWDIERTLVYARRNRSLRFPVYKGHRDNLVGFLLAADLASLKLEREKSAAVRLADLIHEPVVVPLTKKVDEMFDFFKSHEIKAAAVLNEFGGVEGLVTLDDVLHFVFGEICPKTELPGVVHDPKTDVYEVPGDMKLIDFEDLTHFMIEDARMTTIGGVLFRRLDRLPRAGDQVQMDDLLMTVLEMEGHRIARVRVARGEKMKEVPADVGRELSEQSIADSEEGDRP
ncbi:MAG: hemolysin family protein [Gammaproteobacteria bacterium]